MVQYAATHKRLLSKHQVDEFVGNLQAAALSGDTEKAVEQAINSLLVHGLHALHKNADINRSYIHNTDGYITVDNIDTPYALLVEAKRDLELSTSKHDRAVVYAQVCWYLRDLIRAGVHRPSVVVVCDNNEVFALPTTVLVGYAVDDSWPWENYAASTMYQHKPLVNKLELDADIQHPYVHDIAVGFDADMFIRAVDALGQGSAPERVSVTEGALDHVFTRFKMEVLGTDAVGLKNKQEIVLFVDILKGSDDIYAHPKKANTLVWGSKQVTLDTYRYEQFWSQYKIGSYTLAELKEITAIADKLLEETDRRFSGDFWTPPRWVDKAHEYIEKDLGLDWKNNYVVVDPAWGTGNLTRDYKFNELYASTLFQEELDIAADYNPEAVKFQYDFLNDDVWMHEEGITAQDVLDKARSGESKMPLGLVEALAANKPIVFFANPPYGQATSAMGKKHKPGVSATAVTDLMDGMGHAKGELYTQFIWRTKELAKIFGYTSDFHIFFFTSAKFIPSSNFGKFKDELFSEFTFKDGFMMNAGEFNGTSTAWGIVFSHFGIDGTNQRDFDYAVLESDKDMLINTLTDWRGRSVLKGNTLAIWSREKNPKETYLEGFPVSKNGFDQPDQKNTRCRMSKDAIGYFSQDSSNVQGSEKYTSIYSFGFKRGNGHSVNRDNFTRAVVTFAIRRAVYEKFAADKQLWFHWEDIFTRPSESLLTDEFIADCVIYSLFDRKGNQTSLRDYEYQGKNYRVINEFFPFSTEAVLELAQKHHNRTIEADLTGDKERYVYQWLQEHKSDLSTEARAVLHLAWKLIEASFAKREMFAQLKPRYQVESWDAGWKQVNAMIFGRDRIDDELYDEYYDMWKSVVRRLGNKIANLAQEDGVIMYTVGPIIIDPRKEAKVDTGSLNINNTITVSDFAHAVVDKFESREYLVTLFNAGSFIIAEKDREFLSGGNGSGIVLDYDDPDDSLNDLLIQYENEIHKVLTNKTKFDSTYGDVDAIINSDTFIVTKKLKELITECMSLNDIVDLVYFACTDVNGFKEKYC